ncbi:MAG: ribonuclease HI [Desulfobacterales bacterium]
MTASKQRKFYAVARGRKTGVFTDWPTTASLVQGYPGARFKSFPTREAAEAFVRGEKRARSTGKPVKPADVDGRIVVYTDGGSRGNPGPGGYGAVIDLPDGRRELSGGFRLTTNNRMELLACIAALESLKEPSRVALHSDSAYVVNAITLGWAKGWRARGWRRSDGQPALNPDLWARLLDLCEIHDVVFIKVKGHAGVELNERCDRLANLAMDRRDLPADVVFERGIT